MSKNIQVEKIWACIQGDKVQDVIVWDGESEFNPGLKLVEIPRDSHAGIGWDYVDGKFVDNRPTLD
jgi:hypothetical protein